MSELTTPGTPSVLPTRRRDSPHVPSRNNSSASNNQGSPPPASSGLQNNQGESNRTEAEQLAKRRHISIISLTALTIIFAVTFFYFLFNIILPNRHFIRRRQSQCLIVSATLSCWRRNVDLISSSGIEKGRYTCWKFRVRVPHANQTSLSDGNHQNSSSPDDDSVSTTYYHTLTQYNNVQHFPDDRADCIDATSCGMEVWPCQVSVSSPMLVRLHWAFPWLITSFCIMVWFMVICMAIIVAPRLRNGQAHLNTPLRRGIGMSTNSYSSSSIPFSSGRRGQSSVPSQQQEQRQQLSDVPETGNMMASMRRESQVGRLGDSAASARNQSGERGRREDRKRRMSSTPTEGGASAASIHSTRLYRVSLSPNSSNSNR